MRVMVPEGRTDASPQLAFGPTDECRIRAVAGEGLFFNDPEGFNFLGGGMRIGVPEVPVQAKAASVPTLFFGETDQCRISVIEPEGMFFDDPFGFNFRGGPLRLSEETPIHLGVECTIGVDPNLGMIFDDPKGFNFRGGGPLSLSEGTSILFGSTGECRISVDPNLGMILDDPNGFELRSGIAGGTRLTVPAELQEQVSPTLYFGPTNDCSISAFQKTGMAFTDPAGFNFLGGSANFEGSVTASDFIQARQLAQDSSIRFKENVRTIQDPLHTIQRLRAVTFDWKPEYGGQADIGLIAEEVANVVPEAAVFAKDDGTVTGVKYSNLIGVAVEAIKEQQEQIDQQQKRIDKLESELLALKEAVAL